MIIFSYLALLILVSVFSPLARSNIGAQAQAKIASATVIEVKDFTGYRKWTRVNPEPVLMHSSVNMLCRAPTPDNIAQRNRDPHSNKFIIVYVNEIGRHAMMEEKQPKFAVGSVIIKEKLTSKTSTQPELLTVMLKREAGFNPQSGDWEYLVLDGTATKTEARGRLQNCQSCHLSQSTTDFVYRNYLAAETLRGLR